MLDKYTQERIRIARSLRRTGTLSDVGAVLGVTRERARQILLQDEHNQAMPGWTKGLDVRTARILLAEGFKSKRKLKSAIECGARIHRISTLRLVELRRWLHIDTNE